MRCFLLLLVLLTANATAEVRTLTEFYANLDEAATVLKAKADLDAQQSQLHVQEAQKGWRSGDRALRAARVVVARAKADA